MRTVMYWYRSQASGISIRQGQQSERRVHP